MESDIVRAGLNVHDLIVNCLESDICLTGVQVAEKVGKVAQDAGGKAWSPEAIRYQLDKLIAMGKVKHQEQGYFIDRGWKKGQPKAYIFVEASKPKKKGENCQKMLVEEIQGSFTRGEHKGLNLISIDVVMGADFSLIVVVYSDHLHYIGIFVKEYLLGNELVLGTRTIMVWPTES